MHALGSQGLGLIFSHAPERGAACRLGLLLRLRDSYASIRPLMSGGGNVSRSMRSRIAANNLRVTATLASWNVTCFECRVTFTPILTSLSRSVVSD